MSGRCRSLDTAVIGVLFGGAIQQAGFDLDPTVLEDALADLVMMSTSSSNDLLALPSPTSGNGPSIPPTFLQNRFVTGIDFGSLFLIFLICCHLVAGMYAYFVRIKPTRTTVTVTQKQSPVNDAIILLLQGFTDLAICHVRLWRDIHQFITDLQAAVRRNQQHQKIISKLHRQYQGLLRQAEAKAFEVMNEMWQLIQESDRRIKKLVNEARERSSELVSVKSELQAVYEAKQIVQDTPSDCEQRLGQVQEELTENKNENANIRERLDGHIQTSRRSGEELNMMYRDNLVYREALQQHSKDSEAATERHRRGVKISHSATGGT